MWFFNSPRILFGSESLDQLENPLHVNGTKAFIVTDKDMVSLGMLDLVTKRLSSAGISWEVFDGVLPDPPVSVVMTGAKQCTTFAPDLIIALGGGSSIDAAKAIWILYEAGEDFDITGLNPFITLPTGTKAQLVAIPTTSGTGAEVTSAVVLTDDATGLKLELVNRHAIPTLAIVDPVFTLKMPKKLVASTAFDAIAHCIEGMSGSWRNIYTHGLGIVAMRLILDNLHASYNDADPTAREAIHNAATIAGLSFGNAQVHLGHSIGHQLGALWHVPHGAGVGLALPYVMQFLINNDQQVVGVFADLARSVGKAGWSDDDATAARKLLDTIVALQDAVNLPKTLPELGVSVDDVEASIDKYKELIVQSGAITICPVNVNQDIAVKVLRCMATGSPVDF